MKQRVFRSMTSHPIIFKCMSIIRTALKYWTDDQLMPGYRDTPSIPENIPPKDRELLGRARGEMWRYYCNQIGKYTGSSIWLYDQDGEGIRNRGHLNDVLTGWPNLRDKQKGPTYTEKLWVVPADVHF